MTKSKMLSILLLVYTHKIQMPSLFMWQELDCWKRFVYNHLHSTHNGYSKIKMTSNKKLLKFSSHTVKPFNNYIKYNCHLFDFLGRRKKELCISLAIFVLVVCVLEKSKNMKAKHKQIFTKQFIIWLNWKPRSVHDS